MSAHFSETGRLYLWALVLSLLPLALHAQEPLDFGDAREPGYPTKLTSNGARHTLLKGFFLGASIDTEPDGHPDAEAMGDDDQDLDDEDGVCFVTALVPGDLTTVDVVASAPGILDAWVDFNRNLSWADPGEKVFPSTALAAGTNRLTFPVPAAAAKDTYARFRFSQQGELNFYGPAPNGEVEDYRVLVEALDFGDCPDDPEIEPEFELTSPDPEPWDRFGGSVAIDGDWLLVGARGVGGSDYGIGAAYVFHWSGSNRVYQQTLTASDASEDSSFGAEVALEGDWAAVGAFREGSDERGAAYVFTYDGGAWVQKQKLVASPRTAFARFGCSTAFSGGRLVVGAWGDRDADRVIAGSATVFEYDGTNWTEQAKLRPSLGSTGDRFGFDVDTDGDRILVGARTDDVAGVPDAGSAYVYHRIGPDWVEVAYLTAPDGPGEDDDFGLSVAMDGNHLVIGARNRDVGSTTEAGVAYVYRWNGLSWGHQQTLESPTPHIFDEFGIETAMHGLRLCVGAWFEPGAYVFDWGGTNWVLSQSLPLPGGHSGGAYGAAIGLSPLHVAIGAQNTDVGTNDNAGVVIAYPCLPDPYDYPTLFVNDGARHQRIPGVRLGSKDTDTESDGQVHPGALGDDLNADDDEDGIIFLPSVLEPGRSATVRAEASVAGFLSGWMDFNDDGDWDDSHEHVFDNVPVVAGFNNLPFTVSPDAAPAEPETPVFTRFRFATAPVSGYAGYAPDGEVEDHVVLIEEFPEDMDFGDAPDGGDMHYATLLASGGAWHEIVPGAPCFGAAPDAETDGVPSGGADGDDLAGADDEDGVNLARALVVVGMLEIKVDLSASPADGYLNLWIDYTADGDWDDANEHVVQDFLLTAGHGYTLSGNIPANAQPGPGFARARISSSPGLLSWGPAADGEVEDLYAPIHQPSPATPPWITAIAGRNLTAEVEWAAEVGVIYQLQVAGDLTAGTEGDWLDIGPTVTGPANTQTDPAATAPARCYRVVVPWIEEP